MATNNDLRERTFRFASDVIELVEAIPRGRTADVIGRQLLRAATSVGANYRTVHRAQSARHMLSKLAIVEEEADECEYWLQLLLAKNLVPEAEALRLRSEASQLTAIIVASKKTLKATVARSAERRSRFAVRSSEPA